MWEYYEIGAAIFFGMVILSTILFLIFSGGSDDNEDSLDDPEVMGAGPNSNLNEVAAAPIPTVEGNLIQVMSVCNCRKHPSGRCRKRNGKCRLKQGFYRCDRMGCNPNISGMGNVVDMVSQGQYI